MALLTRIDADGTARRGRNVQYGEAFVPSSPDATVPLDWSAATLSVLINTTDEGLVRRRVQWWWKGSTAPAPSMLLLILRAVVLMREPGQRRHITRSRGLQEFYLQKVRRCLALSFPRADCGPDDFLIHAAWANLRVSCSGVVFPAQDILDEAPFPLLQAPQAVHDAKSVNRLTKYLDRQRVEKDVVRQLQQRFNAVSHLVSFACGGISAAHYVNRLLFYELADDQAPHAPQISSPPTPEAKQRVHLARCGTHQNVRSPHLVDVEHSWRRLHLEARDAGVPFGSLVSRDNFVVEDLLTFVRAQLGPAAASAAPDASLPPVTLHLLLWTDGTTIQKQKFATGRARLIDPSRLLVPAGVSPVAPLFDTWAGEKALPDDLLAARSTSISSLWRAGLSDRGVLMGSVWLLDDHAMQQVELGLTFSSLPNYCPCCSCRSVPDMMAELTPINNDRYSYADQAAWSARFADLVTAESARGGSEKAWAARARKILGYPKTDLTALQRLPCPWVPLQDVYICTPLFHCMQHLNWTGLDLMFQLIMPRKQCQIEQVRDEVWGCIRSVAGVKVSRGYFDCKMLRTTVSVLDIILSGYVQQGFLGLATALAFLNSVVWSKSVLDSRSIAFYAVVLHCYLLVSEVVHRHCPGPKASKHAHLHDTIYSHNLLHHSVGFLRTMTEELNVAPYYVQEEGYEAVFHEARHVLEQYSNGHNDLEALHKIRTGTYARSLIPELTGLLTRKRPVGMTCTPAFNVVLHPCIFSTDVHSSAAAFAVPYFQAVKTYWREYVPGVVVITSPDGTVTVVVDPGVRSVPLCVCGTHVPSPAREAASDSLLLKAATADRRAVYACSSRNPVSVRSCVCGSCAATATRPVLCAAAGCAVPYHADCAAKFRRHDALTFVCPPGFGCKATGGKRKTRLPTSAAEEDASDSASGSSAAGSSDAQLSD